jgi:hypothetical protein
MLRGVVLCCVLGLIGSTARADEPLHVGAPADAAPYDWEFLPEVSDRSLHPSYANYSLGVYGEQVWSVGWPLVIVFGTLTLKGFTTWKWGSASFRFNPEGWFGKDTGSFGMDKVGHGFATYAITELFVDQIRVKADEPNGAPITAATLASAVMLYVEIADGFSVDHGFAYEDLLSNTIGSGLSILRSSIPGMHELIDFRMEYLPSGNKKGFHPLTDYSGQKYLLALKLSGFDVTDESFFQYVELHAGYFARGFTKRERRRRVEERRVPYFGVGLNMQQLFFGHERRDQPKLVHYPRRALEYFQLPYTYVAYPSN